MVIKYGFRTWVVLTAYVSYLLIRRASMEDKTLQKAFGKEWDDYKKRVPWKFVPYLI